MEDNIIIGINDLTGVERYYNMIFLTELELLKNPLLIIVIEIRSIFINI